MPLIKNGRIVDDPWLQVTEGETTPEDGSLLVPYAVWKEKREALLRRDGPLGVSLASDQSPSLIADDVVRLDLVALEFPVFSDGRAYSYARLLRERLGFKGELRATGQVLRDQFLFMHRCGFDAFEVADAKAAEAWARALGEISVVYQPTADARRPARALRRTKRNARAQSNGRQSPPTDTVAGHWAY